MATARDVVTLAFRRASLLSLADDLPAEDFAFGKTVLEAQVAEAAETWATDLMDGWLPDSIPAKATMGLSGLVAAETAPVMGGTPPEPRSRALARLRAFLFPDDRDETPDDFDAASSYY